MKGVAYSDLVTAREALPETLQDVITAVTIKALMACTEEGGSVDVAIPPCDLEPLMASGFVCAELLEPLERDPERFRVIVEDGSLKVLNRPM